MTRAPTSPGFTAWPSGSSTWTSQPGTARRQFLDAEAIRGDRPARLGLPPVTDDRHAKLLLGPFDGWRIGALAGEEEGAEFRQIVPADQLTLGVLAADRPERRRRR